MAEWLSPAQAGRLFPGGLKGEAVRERMKEGRHGVPLQHRFDGRKYWTKAEWVTEHLEQLTHQQSPLADWQSPGDYDAELAAFEARWGPGGKG